MSLQHDYEGFQPEVLAPTPDPFFVRELRKIDPELRVVWGYLRYMVRQWAIERRMSPERYYQMYAGLFESDQERFVDQPIFDTNQPITDEHGEFVTYKQIGSRKYDLAPEHEWVMFTQTLDMRTITELKRRYAWERNHTLTRLKMEREMEEAKRKEARAKKTAEIGMEGVREAWRQAGKIVQGEQPKKVMEGTEL